MATTRDQRRLGTAEAVLKAAGELFFARGFSRTTVRDIAESCGVSVGTVMAVGDKSALLVAVMDDRIRRVHAERRGRARTGGGRACADEIVAQLDPFVSLFARHPNLARHYAAILVGGDHRSVVFTELAAMLIEEIATILSSSGGVPERRAAALAEAVYFAYIGRLFTVQPDDGPDADRLRADLRRNITAIVSRTERPA